MGDVELVHVRDVEGAVRGIGDVDGAEGRVRAADEDAAVACLEGGTAGTSLGGDDLAAKGIQGEEEAGERGRQGGSVGERPEVREAGHAVGRGHHRQFAEGIGVPGRSELPGIDALHQVESTLDEVPAAGASTVVAGVEAADGIELESVGVAAAFGEDLESPGVGVVTPDHAAFEVDAGCVRWIETRSRDTTGHGAALATVEPAVRPPREAIRDCVGVFESEASESHLGRTIRNVVAVPIRIKEQVGRVHHPDSAVALDRGGGEIQAVDEDRVAVVSSVRPAGFMDREDVGAAVVVWRWGRDLVVVGAIVLVATQHPDAGRVGVLAGLRHPKPTTVVEGEVEGLGDGGFVEDEFGAETLEALLAGGRLGGRQRGARDLFGAAEDPLGFAEGGEGCSRWWGRKCGTGLIVPSGEVFPRAFEDTLDEVIHDERRGPQERGRALWQVDPDGDLVPLTLPEGADRDLVSVDGFLAATVVRWK